MPTCLKENLQTNPEDSTQVSDVGNRRFVAKLPLQTRKHLKGLEIIIVITPWNNSRDSN